MKLKTMLLPTGEFIIVGSEAPADDLPPNEVMRSFADGTGAAGVLFSRHEIDVEDALFDENARRRPPMADPEGPPVEDDDEPETVDETNYFRTFVPNFKPDFPSFTVDGNGVATLSGTAVTSDWVDIGSMDVDALETYFGVSFDREYGPAGQVKGQPGDPDFLASEAFQQGEEPRVEVEDSTEVLAVSTEDFGQEVPEERPVEPKPQPGDTVRIVGDSCWHQEKDGQLRDVIGKVASYNRFPEHGTLVEFAHPDPTYPYPECRWFFPDASLEVVR